MSVSVIFVRGLMFNGADKFVATIRQHDCKNNDSACNGRWAAGVRYFLRSGTVQTINYCMDITLSSYG